MSTRAPRDSRPIDATITVEELERDPYPVYRRLRRTAPVCFVPAVQSWLVTGWAAATEVAADPDAFGPAEDSPLRRNLGENVLTVGGGAHARLRGSMEPRLKRGEVSRYAPELARRIAEEEVAKILDTGRGDLMADYLEPVTVRCLAEVMGVGDIEVETLRRWFAELAAGGGNYEHDPHKDATAGRAVAEIDAAIRRRLPRLRAAAPEERGLVGDMLQSHGEGRPLTDDEVMANVNLLLLGGMQEPGHAAGNLLWSLLTHPEELDDVLADLDRLEGAMEEGLRWLAPVGTATREVHRATTLGGVQLMPGERLAVVLAAINRDEDRFPDAERFDVRRDSRHRAFGIGGHFCVGHWLARWEIRTPVRLLLESMSGLRLDPERPSELRGWEFRGPRALHCVWRARRESG